MMHAASEAPPAPVRAGATILSLIAGSLTVSILRAHRDEALRLPDLRERLEGAAQTTLRGQVGNLRALGALERHVRSGMPYTVENELTETGLGVLSVADVVERWLGRAPQGPIPLGSEAAKGAIRALVGGWDSNVLTVLADRPRSLTELSSAIADHSYPSLERRLSALRAACQVEAQPDDHRGAKPYALNDWTRQAVAPLLAASHREGLYLTAKAAPLTRSDMEVIFLLAAPLIELEAPCVGSCLLVVDTAASVEGESTGSHVAGVNVEIEKGEVVSCASRQERECSSWALGAIGPWVEAILEGRFDGLRIGGENPCLTKAVVAGMHEALASA